MLYFLVIVLPLLLAILWVALQLLRGRRAVLMSRRDWLEAQDADPRETIAACEKALADNPEDAEALARLADAHNSLGVNLDEKQQSREALDHLRKAVELEPGNGQYLENLSSVLASAGKASEARRHLRAARATGFKVDRELVEEVGLDE